MPTLTEAETAADAAHGAYSEALVAATAARTHATDLRERVRGGRADDVAPGDLARASEIADHLALVAEGARACMAERQEEVQALRRDELCDQIVSTVPVLGQAVTDALEVLSKAVAVYVGRVTDFNAFAVSSVNQLDKAGQGGSRVNVPRYGSPSVDGVPIGPLHGDRNLMAELLLALRDLKAPAYFIAEAQTVAAAAAAIPTA